MPVTLPPGRAEARDDAETDRIRRPGEDHRDRRGRSLGGERRGSAPCRQEHRDVQADELRREPGQLRIAPLRPAERDRDVAPLDEAGFGQAFAERRDDGRRLARRPAAQEADRRRGRLLRARRQRPRRRGAKPREHVPPPHSITSSASKSNGRGTSMPSVRAVLRFTTSWNFAGRSMGRSAGRVPASTLATICPD